MTITTVVAAALVLAYAAIVFVYAETADSTLPGMLMCLLLSAASHLWLSTLCLSLPNVFHQYMCVVGCCQMSPML